MRSKILTTLFVSLFSLLYNSLGVLPTFTETYSAFSMKSGTAIKSGSSSAYKTIEVSMRLKCAASCSHDTRCLSYYAAPKNTTPETNKKLLDCWLFDKKISHNELSIGSGSYGRMDTFSFKSGSSEPVYTNCNFQMMTRTEHGLALIYDCSAENSRMSNIGVLYDDVKNEWPTLNSACSSNLAAQFGLAGTLMKITKNATKTNSFDFEFFCQKDEYNWGSAECDGFGVWRFSGTVAAGCISTTCKRHDHDHRGLYKGTLAVAKGIYKCQTWTSQTPNSHDMRPSEFLLDNFDMVAAKNYCRDPDYSGYPWCYTIDGPRWTGCNLPLCELKFNA